MTTQITAQQALEALTELGYVWKVWSEQDVKDRIREMRNDEYPTLTGEDFNEERLVEEVINSSNFSALANCTDPDWQLLDEAIYEALEDM